VRAFVDRIDPFALRIEQVRLNAAAKIRADLQIPVMRAELTDGILQREE
jgi:hypothetical protein